MHGGSNALVSTSLLSIHPPPLQLAKQLLYSRFVNTRGQRGKNIPADLHNEHLNKACKTALGHLGPNTSINHIQVVSRSLGTLVPTCILENFEF